MGQETLRVQGHLFSFPAAEDRVVGLFISSSDFNSSLSPQNAGPTSHNPVARPQRLRLTNRSTPRQLLTLTPGSSKGP